ncbi:MAG: hypothetical protein WCI34_00450 [Actinomycetes bacterium]|nr:hypothetical protein [Solirubrobacterales bacterium]MSW87620.1 hypothetical protein [Actinomycetota bacterium]
MEAGVVLRNRLVVATNTWRTHVGGPLPKIPKGHPQDQIEAFEMALIERLAADATPQNASEVAERTWDLVHDRPEDDPIKARVMELHTELIKLGPPIIEP